LFIGNCGIIHRVTHAAVFSLEGRASGRRNYRKYAHNVNTAKNESRKPYTNLKYSTHYKTIID